MKNQPIVVFCNTKGGVGKSVLASMVAPVLCGGKRIHVYELDDHNNTVFTNSEQVVFKSLPVQKIDNVIDSINFDILTQTDTSVFNIIDAGGGNDTKMVLQSIKKSGLSGITYIIPTNNDIEQVSNIYDTIDLIKNTDESAIIYLVLNRIKSMNESSIKEQFINIFGSKKYGIKSNEENIKKQVSGVMFVPDTNLFDILKNIHNRSLLDSYKDAINIIKNIEQLKITWAKQGKEVFNKNMALYRLAQDIIALVNQLQPLTIIFNKGK